jgi:hypothetical protein
MATLAIDKDELDRLARDPQANRDAIAEILPTLAAIVAARCRIAKAARDDLIAALVLHFWHVLPKFDPNRSSAFSFLYFSGLRQAFKFAHREFRDGQLQTNSLDAQGFAVRDSSDGEVENGRRVRRMLCCDYRPPANRKPVDMLHELKRAIQRAAVALESHANGRPIDTTNDRIGGYLTGVLAGLQTVHVMATGKVVRCAKGKAAIGGDWRALVDRTRELIFTRAETPPAT